MRIGSADDNKVIVSIKRATRDNREEVKDEKTNKMVKNKMFGKIVYESHESIDVYDATPEEVTTAVTNGLKAATGKR